MWPALIPLLLGVAITQRSVDLPLYTFLLESVHVCTEIPKTLLFFSHVANLGTLLFYICSSFCGSQSFTAKFESGLPMIRSLSKELVTLNTFLQH